MQCAPHPRIVFRVHCCPVSAHIVQEALLAEATSFRDQNVVDVTSYDELKAVIADGRWARAGWCASDEHEKQVKEDTGATLRCIPFDQPAGVHRCVMTGKDCREVAIFAKAY